MRNIVARNLIAGAFALIGASLCSPGAAWATDYGKPGEPVHLVVGYQPYYTESWSGAIVNAKELWKKYLPAGSTVEFQVGLQGAVIVNAMTGEKQQIGYVGDMPGIVATFRNLPDRGATDIRIVGTLGTSKQMCNIFLVRKDAPAFASGKDAVKWMTDKIVASPHGSCTDRFAQDAFKSEDVKPKSYLNQSIEVITTNFRAGKLDAAVVWEPTATKIVEAGLARRVASGEDFDAVDGGFLIMLGELMKQRPDVVKGWMQAELDAQLFMLDPNNATEISKILEKQTEQLDRKIIWDSLYGENPASAGGGKTKLQLDYTVDDRAKKLIDQATVFLNSLPNKPAAAPKIRDGGVDDAAAREVLADRKLSAPLGTISARPESDFK